MTSKRYVSVIVPCHAGHADVLPTCLATLCAQVDAGPYEIIVVNSDGSEAVAAAARPYHVHLMEGQGATAGTARNLGVAVAKGDVLAFIDADCAAERHWLATLARGADPEVAVTGPVLNYHPLHLPRHAIAAADNLMQFIDHLPGRPAGPVTLAPACNLAVPTVMFREAGGFPEGVQPGEDTLLTGSIARRWPGRLQFIPEMRVSHRGRTSLRELLVHQGGFGLSRGHHGFNLSPRRQQLGTHGVFAALEAIKRYLYFLGRTAQWNLKSLPGVLLLTPVLLIGLTGWARGFQLGCRTAQEGTGSSTNS